MEATSPVKDASKKKKPQWQKISSNIPILVNTEGRIGSGAFGSVYEARRYQRTPDGKSLTLHEKYVVKMAKYGAGTRATYRQAAVEVSALHKLTLNTQVSSGNNNPEAGGATYSSTNRLPEDKKQPMGHENVVGMYWCEARTVPNGCLYMVLEYCNGKDFLHHIQSGALRGNEVRVRRFFSHFLKGLGFMLAQGVQHRDLKPPNLLLSGDLDTGTLKIGDFGLSKVKEHSFSQQVELSRGAEILQSQCGSKRYWAPERARGEQYGPSAEIFAAGLILYEMLTGQCFVSPRATEEQLERELTKQLSFKEPGLVSPEATDLLRLLLAHDPKDRPSWRAALAHEWFDPIRSEIDPDGKLPPRKQSIILPAPTSAPPAKTPCSSESNASNEEGYAVFGAANILAQKVAHAYYLDVADDPSAQALVLAWLCQVVEAAFFGLSPRAECAAVVHSWRSQAKMELHQTGKTDAGSGTTRLAPWALVFAFVKHLYQLERRIILRVLQIASAGTTTASSKNEEGEEGEESTFTEYVACRGNIEELHLILGSLLTCCRVLLKRQRDAGGSEGVAPLHEARCPTLLEYSEIHHFYDATQRLLNGRDGMAKKGQEE